MRRFAWPTAALLLAFSLGANAAPLPVKDWVRFAEFRQAIISPGGKYLAIALKEKKSQHYDLAVMTTASVLANKLKTIAHIRLGEHELFGPIFWVNNHRIVAGTARYFGGFDRPYLDGTLFAINADGGQEETLMGPSSAGQQLGTRTAGTNALVFFGGLLSRLPAEHNNILVEGWTPDSRIPFAYKLDTVTDRFFRVATGLFGGGMLADHDGVVRVKWGLNEKTGWPELRYLPQGASDWKDMTAQLSSNKDTAVAMETSPVRPVMFGPQNRELYLTDWTDNSAKTIGLYAMDTQSGKAKLVYASPTVDVGYSGFADAYIKTFDRKSLIGLRTMPGLPDTEILDAKSPKVRLLAGLNQALSTRQFEITSWTDDGTEAVVETWSDDQPTEFYLYSSKPKPSLTLLFRQTPWIKAGDLSPEKPITYTARDGVTIHGYLAVPRGAKAKNLPLVIYVHGGPHGARYDWGFDATEPDAVATQILADNGYAVLAPNYRGSGGYGLKFLVAGFRHWGDTMQNDLADAAEWAVKQGIADPKRVCILGASYGGYAALMSSERFPSLYRCAVGYSGVYDLMLQETRRAGADRYAGGRFYLATVLGHDHKQLKAFSPAFNADSLKAAVLLLHGGRDQRAPVKGYDEMVAAIKKHGTPLETLYFHNEGHGFYQPAHREQAWTKILAFLKQYIGAGEPSATGKTGN